MVRAHQSGCAMDQFTLHQIDQYQKMAGGHAATSGAATAVKGPEKGMLEFDPAWYMRAYPQVASAIASGRWTSALDHYQQVGNKEGLSPNGLFDEVWYRDA